MREDERIRVLGCEGAMGLGFYRVFLIMRGIVEGAGEKQGRRGRENKEKRREERKEREKKK